MVTIFVEGKEHEVREGKNLLHAVLELGYDLPYFCWHPALGSMGACRQCAVKQFRDADDTTGTIIMACMTPVSDGLRISIDDDDAREFRASVIEWYMTNHPHDCPVCDEGGECHLQDMTVISGHNRRRHRFPKRTHRNQDLGPFINHEMNRCIACYRCVRFYRDYAGGADLNVFGSRNRVYFGRFADGTLESPFSGNLVEVCPTGVFTDKNAAARSVRAWDLQTAPSVCPHCGLGCNTLPGERNGTLRRVRNRYHGEINRHFLCDRGRYGFEFVNSPGRLRHPVLRTDEDARPVTAEVAVDHVASLVADGGAIGIGSPTASLEANYALRRLVGAERFFMGTGDAETARVRLAIELVRSPPVRTPSLREVERADAVLVLGEDVTNTAPLLDLALRQAVLNVPKERVRELGIPEWNDSVVRLVINHENGPLFIATPAATALDEIASGIVRAAPQDVARLGDAIASMIDHDAPSPGNLPVDTARIADAAAEALARAARPLVVAGTCSGQIATLRAAANVVRALSRKNPDAALTLVVPDCNSVGAGLLGAPALPNAIDRDAVRTAIVLEPDPANRERRAALDAVLDGVGHVVVLGHLEDALTARAEVVLPTSTFAESNGTLVNNEGRAQRFFQVFPPVGGAVTGWRWLSDIARRVDGAETASWTGRHDVVRSMIAELPVFGPVADLEPTPPEGPRQRVPRQSHRVTGRTAVNAHLDIHEARPPEDRESPMAFSMEGNPHRPPPDLITRYWTPGWNSVQALTRFLDEIGGPLRGGDPGVRLFTGVSENGSGGFFPPGEAIAPRDGEWRLVALHHLFGSERQSLETPGIAELAPAPYIGLGPADAAELEIAEGDTLEVDLGGQKHKLPFKPVAGLPKGCAGLAEGLPEIAALPTGSWAKIRRPS